VTLPQFQGSPSEHGSASLSHSLIHFFLPQSPAKFSFRITNKTLWKINKSSLKKRDRGVEEGWKNSVGFVV
jgi:hypothetical protein